VVRGRGSGGGGGGGGGRELSGKGEDRREEVGGVRGGRKGCGERWGVDGSRGLCMGGQGEEAGGGEGGYVSLVGKKDVSETRRRGGGGGDRGER